MIQKVETVGLSRYIKLQSEKPAPRNTKNAAKKMQRAIEFKGRANRIRKYLAVPDISAPLRRFVDQSNLRKQAGELGRAIELLEPEKVLDFAENIDQHNPDRNPKFGGLLSEVQEIVLIIGKAVGTSQGSESISLKEKLAAVLQATEPGKLQQKIISIHNKFIER